MTSCVGRGLRRVIDSLQRGLFDELPAAPAALPVADPPMRHPQATRELSLDGQRIAFRLARVRRRSIGFVVDGLGLTVFRYNIGGGDQPSDGADAHGALSVASSDAPEMISGVRASSIRIESTSSTMA